MTDQTIELPWGEEIIRLSLPPDWKILGVLDPTSKTPVDNLKIEIIQSVTHPIKTEPLRNFDLFGKKVAVVIDDISRPTPVHEIFPIVLTELHTAGVSNENITIIPALGVHRGMELDEILARTGLNDLDGIKWENPDADDPDKQEFLGTTSRGTPVLINRTAARSDFIVSIGCIEPHIIASFGGGYKNILPGIAARVSIAHNHAQNCQPDTFNMVGQPIDQNPMRQDLEEAGQMLKPPVFVINAILDNHQQVVRVVAGDPIAAHRAGVEVSSGLYGVQVPAKADIVITDSHPMDSDLRQGVKALANTVRAIKPGGVLITLVKANEGVGVFGLANKKLPLGKKALQLLAPVILPLVKKLKLRGMGEEDRFFLYFALQAMRMGHLLLYAPTIPASIHPNLPFVTFQSSPEECIRFASAHAPKNPTVLIFPNGGITYPIL